MNLKRLHYFVVVAEELHFGRAAQRLHMAQPPLSQQIRTLESEVRADLFDRTTRRVELTAAGRTLYSEARKLLRDVDTVERLMAEHRCGDSGLLRLGFVDSSSYAVMPRFLGAYRERWPGVSFELRSMSSEAQRHSLAQGDIDIGIARTRGEEPGLVHTVILEEQLYVAVASGHGLTRRNSVSLKDLAAESFISFTQTESPALTGELKEMLNAAGVDYAPIIEAEEYTTIVGLVAAGEGIAIVPAAVQSFRPPNLVYLRLEDADATTRLMLLTRDGEPLRVAQNALELARDRFGAHH